MEVICVVLGKDVDRASYQGHFGDAPLFETYHIRSTGAVERQREFANQQRETDECHGSTGKMGAILAGIPEADCVIASRMSPNFKKIATTSVVQPVIAEARAMEPLLRLLGENFEFLASLVERRKAGERPADIPVLKEV